MKINLNGTKYKYQPFYIKEEDIYNIKFAQFKPKRSGKIFHKNQWKNCNFFIFKKNRKTYIEIFSNSFQNGISEIGKVDNQGKLVTVELKLINKLKIKTFDFVYLSKIYFLSRIDKIKFIRKNLIFIVAASIGAITYFLINHFFNNYLETIIKESNIIQSIIIFLTLSSVINIFYPFTLRRELSLNEIDILIKQRIKENNKNLEHKDYIRSKSQ